MLRRDSLRRGLLHRQGCRPQAPQSPAARRFSTFFIAMLGVVLSGSTCKNSNSTLCSGCGAASEEIQVRLLR